MSDEFRTALGRTEERWSAQLDRLFERFEKSVDRLEAKFDLRMDATDRSVQSEFTEAKLAAGELRDGIALLKDRVSDLEENRDHNMRASAEGAAKGAGEAAGAVAATSAALISDQVIAAVALAASNHRKPFMETVWGKAVIVGTGVSALAGAIGLVPNIIKYGGLLLHFIGGFAK